MIAPFYENFDMNKWKALMEQFGLDIRKKPEQYSKGMQMKFMLAMALAHDPEILIWDEPTAGMDPAARTEWMEMIQTFMEAEDKTVIFSTHITSDLDKFADYIICMSKGQAVFMEEKDALLEQYALVQMKKEDMTAELSKKLIGGRVTVEDFLIYEEGL